MANENGQLPPKWDIQSLDSIATTINSGTIKNVTTLAEDDLGLLKKAKRPHLSEVFPNRYSKWANLLVLDRAVYLYMQFVNIRQSLLISLPTIRAFIRQFIPFLFPFYFVIEFQKM